MYVSMSSKLAFSFIFALIFIMLQWQTGTSMTSVGNVCIDLCNHGNSTWFIIQDHRKGVVQIANFIGCCLSDEVIDRVVEHSSMKGMSRSYHTWKDLTVQCRESKSADGNESSQKKTGPSTMLRKGRLSCCQGSIPNLHPGNLMIRPFNSMILMASALWIYV